MLARLWAIRELCVQGAALLGQTVLARVSGLTAPEVNRRLPFRILRSAESLFQSMRLFEATDEQGLSG